MRGQIRGASEPFFFGKFQIERRHFVSVSVAALYERRTFPLGNRSCTNSVAVRDHFNLPLPPSLPLTLII